MKSNYHEFDITKSILVAMFNHFDYGLQNLQSILQMTSDIIPMARLERPDHVYLYPILILFLKGENIKSNSVDFDH